MTDIAIAGNAPIVERRGLVQAMAFAAKGGAALNTLMAGIADRKAAERMGSIQAMCFLVEHFSDDEQHAVPKVGSKKEENSNLPYDKYSKEITTPEGKRTVQGSWFTDVIHALPEYERIQTTKRWLDGVYEEGEQVPDAITAIAKTGEAGTQKQMLSDRISDMRTGLTKGSMLFHHAEEISAINPERIKVKMPWREEYLIHNGERVKNEDGSFKTTLTVYGSKIRLQDPAGEFEDKIYSVSSFLQLKPDNETFLKEPLKTIVALDKTTARPPKIGQTPGTAADVKVPVTLEQVLTQFNALASGLNQEDDKGERMYLALLTKASGNTDEARETRASIAKVALALDSLWTIISPMHTRDTEAAAKAAIAAQVAAG